MLIGRTRSFITLITPTLAIIFKVVVTVSCNVNDNVFVGFFPFFSLSLIYLSAPTNRIVTKIFINSFFQFDLTLKHINMTIKIVYPHFIKPYRLSYVSKQTLTYQTNGIVNIRIHQVTISIVQMTAIEMYGGRLEPIFNYRSTGPSLHRHRSIFIVPSSLFHRSFAVNSITYECIEVLLSL